MDYVEVLVVRPSEPYAILARCGQTLVVIHVKILYGAMGVPPHQVLVPE